MLFVHAAHVLHNYCMDNNDNFMEEGDQEQKTYTAGAGNAARTSAAATEREAKAVRQALTLYLQN